MSLIVLKVHSFHPLANMWTGLSRKLLSILVRSVDCRGKWHAALHISFLLLGVQNGDEVLIPGLTFVATANAVSYCGASPHFVDSEEDTLGGSHKIR